MRARTALVAAAVLLSSCGGGDGSASLDSSSSAESSAVAISETIDITLEVGASAGADVTHDVALGSTVRISITNPSEDDEYHLHGYDLTTGEVPAGETAIIEFVADVTGSFELESHHSGDLLMTLVVE